MFTLILINDNSFHIRQFPTKEDLEGAAEAIIRVGAGEGLCAVFGYGKTGKLMFEHVEEGE